MLVVWFLRVAGIMSRHILKNKIGKFGLGFCSVYNLTDVPCILSNKTFVVLDPHFHHLGDFIRSLNNVPSYPFVVQSLKLHPNILWYGLN
jgi:hypothetical protein